MAWFKKSKGLKAEKKIKIPEGLWVKCDSCREIIYKKEIDNNLKICPKCNYHFRISAKERILLLVDEDSFTEIDAGLSSTDPLGFRDKVPYRERLEENRKKSELEERHCQEKRRSRDIPSWWSSWTSLSWAGAWVLS